MGENLSEMTVSRRDCVFRHDDVLALTTKCAEVVAKAHPHALHMLKGHAALHHSQHGF